MALGAGDVQFDSRAYQHPLHVETGEEKSALGWEKGVCYGKMLLGTGWSQAWCQMKLFCDSVTKSDTSLELR